MSINKIEYTVTKTDIIPKVEQCGGQQGDDGITNIIFTVDSELFSAINEIEGDTLYRVQTIDGAGVLHTSMPLDISSDHKIVYPLKREITIRGGTAFAHLVIYKNDNGNEREMYSFAARIRFRDTAGIGDERQFSERLSEMLSDVDKYIGDKIDEKSSATPTAGNIALYGEGGTLKVGTPQANNDSVPLSKLNEELEKKVDKVKGKGLSTNDYTDEAKTKLESIEKGAQKNTPADQTYNPESENAQSGKAVAEALENLDVEVSEAANALKGTKSGNVIKCDDVSPFKHDIKLTVPYFKKLDYEVYTGEFSDKDFTLSDTESTTKKCIKFTTENECIKISCNVPLVITSFVLDNSQFITLDEVLNIPYTFSGGSGTHGFNLQRADGQAWNGEEIITVHNSYPVSFVVSQYGSNLLPYPYADGTRSLNGIDITVNDDGSLDISGTATAARSFFFANNETFKLPAGTYTISISGDFSVSAQSYLWLYKTSTEQQIAFVPFSAPNSVKFTLIEPTSFNVYFLFERDTIINGNFKVQIEYGDTATDYQPFIKNEYTEYDENGMFTGVKSIYPSMTFIDSVMLEYNIPTDMVCEYNKDINTMDIQDEQYRVLQRFTLSEDVTELNFTTDSDGKQLNLKKARLYIKGTSTVARVDVFINQSTSTYDTTYPYYYNAMTANTNVSACLIIDEYFNRFRRTEWLSLPTTSYTTNAGSQVRIVKSGTKPITSIKLHFNDGTLLTDAEIMLEGVDL